jgi:methylase of polypeptide subunit release factors
VPALGSELPQSLHQQTEAWCERHGFDALADPATQEIVAQQAVFGLLLRVTLYEWHHQHDGRPALSDDPLEAVGQVQAQSDTTGFDAWVLDGLMEFADEAVLEALLEERFRILYSAQPAEDIGRVYEMVTPDESRRVLGQYRTPPEIAQLMRTWAASNDNQLLDPGMGPGCLSTPVHPQWEASTGPKRVVGVDQSPLTALMGITAQTLAGQPHALRTTDFLELSPTDLQRDVDAIVCNPPYTRHNLLSTRYKDELNTQAEDQTGLDVPRTSPLYAYFTYHIRQFLDAESRAAVLTPHHFLAREYGTSLKRFLLREFNVKAFVMSDPDTGSRFENAQTTELVAFLESGSAESDTGVTRFIRVDEDPGYRTILEAVRNTEQGETEWGFVNCINQADLDPERKWDVFFDPIDVDTSHLTPFSELADISRGLQTGENDFFCLSQAEVESTGINTRCLSRMVPPPRFVDSYDVRPDDWDKYSEQGRPTWLLYHVDSVEGVPETTYDKEAKCVDWCESSLNAESAPAVVEYLCHGLPGHETLQTRKTVHTRDPWYRVERGETAPILIAPMTRSKARVLLNETDARHLNSYYGIYPESTIGRTEQKALLAYLNSEFVDSIVSRHQRTLAGGLDKLEPGDVKKLPVIDPRELPDEVVNILAECFDELREAARRDENQTAVINRIDTVLQREL